MELFAVGYIAPELYSVRPPPYSKAADVFGLGVVIWECLTQLSVHSRDSNSTPPWTCLARCVTLEKIERALDPKPHTRPTAAELCALLTAL